MSNFIAEIQGLQKLRSESIAKGSQTPRSKKTTPDRKAKRFRKSLMNRLTEFFVKARTKVRYLSEDQFTISVSNSSVTPAQMIPVAMVKIFEGDIIVEGYLVPIAKAIMPESSHLPATPWFLAMILETLGMWNRSSDVRIVKNEGDWLSIRVFLATRPI